MTQKDAKKLVSDVIINVDSGCSHCIENCLKDLNKAFPEIDWYSLAQEYMDD